MLFVFRPSSSICQNSVMQICFAPRAPLCEVVRQFCEAALPLALPCARKCASSARRLRPSRSPLGASHAPKPPAIDVWRMSIAPAHASIYMPKHRSLAAGSDLPVGMRAKRSAYACIESGYPGAKPWAGSAEGAAALCRRPRRAHTHCTEEGAEGAAALCRRPRRAIAFLGVQGAGAPCHHPRREHVARKKVLGAQPPAQAANWKSA
jgi:hypothetical protein